MITLGIDVGASKTAVGVFDSGVLLNSSVTATLDFESTMADIAALVTKWHYHASLKAVGVACTGPLDIESGTVLNQATLQGWFGKSIPDAIQSMFAASTALINDADAAILGEVFEGSNGLVETEPAVMLTFGTGVGGAFWDGKNIYAGAHGEHPEIGHVGVDPNGPLCYCGVRGCLESVASGPAIDGLTRDLGSGGIESLGPAIEAGNKNAIGIASRTRMAISYALVSLTHTFRPSCFILGGGVMEKLHHSLAPLTVPVNPSTVPGPPPRILLASLGNRAGMHGASVAARRLVLDN
jgi:glucokinase